MIKLLILSATIFTTLILSACSDSQQESIDKASRHLKTANAYIQQGQFRASMLEVKNAVQLRPQDANGYILLAKIYSEMGAHTSTQKLLEPRVKSQPELLPALAEAYIANNKASSALKLLQGYSADNHSGYSLSDILILTARAQIQTKEHDNFAATMEELQKIDGVASTTLFYLNALEKTSMGDYELGQSLLSQSLQENPDHFDSLILQGDIAHFQNKLDKAEELYSRALGTLKSSDIITVNRVQVLNKLAETLIQQGRTSEAYTYQKLLADSNPEHHAAQQKFKLALSEYTKGDLNKARDILEELHQQFPNEKSSATLLGLIQYQLGESSKASEIFDHFIDTETASAPLLQAAAQAKFKQNMAKEAVDMLRLAVEQQPNDAAILATYGLAALETNPKDSKAAHALEKSLALNPSQQRLRLALAKYYKAADQKEQAFAQLEIAYKTQPLDTAIQKAYFHNLFLQNNPKRNLQAVKDFQTQYPDDAQGLMLLSLYHLNQSDYAATERALNSYLNKGGDKSRAYAAFAQLHEKQSNLDKAANYWRKSLLENPSSNIAYTRLFTVLTKTNQQASGLAFLKELESAHPSEWKPSAALAQLLSRNHRFEEAIQHANTAEKRAPDNRALKSILANIHYKYGLNLRSKKQFSDSKKQILIATKLYPDNIGYLSALIKTEIDLNNTTEAKKLISQLPDTEKSQSARFYFLALTLIKEKNAPEALAALEKSWQSSPNDINAQATYNILNKLGKHQDASEFLNIWHQELPKSAKATLLSGLSAQKNGATRNAIEWYEKTVALAPKQAAALNNLAWLYFEEKDTRALETAKRAYDSAPNSAAILDTYGWILFHNGNNKKAQLILSQAAAAAPNDADIQSHLREVQSSH